MSVMHPLINGYVNIVLFSKPWLFIKGVTLVGGKIFVIGGFVDAELMDRGTSSVDSYSLDTGEAFYAAFSNINVYIVLYDLF